MPRLATAPTVQERAASLESELAALRQIDAVIAMVRTLKRKHPNLVDEFTAQLHAVIDDDPPPQESESGILQTVADAGEQEYGVTKLIAWFRSRNNEPATLRQMAEAVDLNARTVKSILYTRHKGKFVTIKQRGPNNSAYFRMADD